LSTWTEQDQDPRFLVETTLGRLLRWLRLMGLAADLAPRVPPAAPPGAVVLTRRRALGGRRGVVVVRRDDLEGQLAQLRDETGLMPRSERLFTRCLVCGQEVEAITREQAAGLVPDYTLHTARRFTRCHGCGRVYWPGSHGQRAAELLARVWGEGWDKDGRLEPPQRRGQARIGKCKY